MPGHPGKVACSSSKPFHGRAPKARDHDAQIAHALGSPAACPIATENLVLVRWVSVVKHGAHQVRDSRIRGPRDQRNMSDARHGVGTAW